MNFSGQSVSSLALIQMDLKCCFFCDKSSKESQICDLCHNVTFCDEHKNIHQPNGLGTCLPFTIGRLEDVGRILKASRDISKGQLALLDRAFTLGKCF